MPSLSMQTRQDGTVTVVSVAGRMTYDVLHPLNAHLQDLFSSRRPEVLVINLQEVSLLDSSGIGLLVSARNNMNRAMGHLYICGLQPRVRETFARMNLLAYFPVLETEQEALQYARQLQPAR